jgi:hypothetical protein
MTETRDHTERTDRLAEDAAHNTLEDLMRDILPSVGGKTAIAATILAAHTVTWEQGVNADGQAGPPLRAARGVGGRPAARAGTDPVRRHRALPRRTRRRCIY